MALSLNLCFFSSALAAEDTVVGMQMEPAAVPACTVAQGMSICVFFCSLLTVNSVQRT